MANDLLGVGMRLGQTGTGLHALNSFAAAILLMAGGATERHVGINSNALEPQGIYWFFSPGFEPVRDAHR